jgi:hypothetical protein
VLKVLLLGCCLMLWASVALRSGAIVHLLLHHLHITHKRGTRV